MCVCVCVCVRFVEFPKEIAITSLKSINEHVLAINMSIVICDVITNFYIWLREMWDFAKLNVHAVANIVINTE